MKLQTALKHLHPKYLVRNRSGFCPVCGHRSLFLLTGDAATIRNHAICVLCGSSSRNRHLALCVLQTFPSRGHRSLSALGRDREVAIYHTAATGPVSRALGPGPNVARSEFLPGVAPGERRGDVQCQDLERLTFREASFDLVLSEDVFEHLADYRAGFREVHRVLKRGGSHVFTVPFYFDRRTRDLWEDVGGRRLLKEPVEYHGDPIRGDIPCYSHFGYDVLDFLRDIGFEVSVAMSRFETEIRYGTFDCYTLITTKT